VTADDFGIGPETTRGILDLACQGRVTAAVLLVNSPFAEEAVRAWRVAGKPGDLGWHPCLTLDQPILPAERVPSLVDPRTGRFWPLRSLLLRLHRRQVCRAEVALELGAQLRQFIRLVGAPPVLVNSHQHVGLFEPVGDALRKLLADLRPMPYMRRVRETWQTLSQVPGARLKRLFLTWHGSRDAREQDRLGFPGNDSLAGIGCNRCVRDPDYLERWLRSAPGRVVELMVHPGYRDVTLLGRDCHPGDGGLERREWEMRWLSETRFLRACEAAGFALTGTERLSPHLLRQAV
jgi:predicted glycoside hydrolase/deacetylase ChbG (UPF0249 family)